MVSVRDHGVTALVEAGNSAKASVVSSTNSAVAQSQVLPVQLISLSVSATVGVLAACAMVVIAAFLAGTAWGRRRAASPDDVVVTVNRLGVAAENPMLGDSTKSTS